ncbi:response regulator [Geobacter sp. 60473]|uniref:response regulator n=1 Tax=Geobacter sp. 60473 TaxID=3080755 RepID=UPI002B2DAD62|nr:response regulator [Geobacter sp. 60473]
MGGVMAEEGGGRRILWVECDGEKRKNLGFVLKLAGYRVTPVRTSYEALDWVVKRQGTPERFFALVLGSLTCAPGGSWLVGQLNRSGAALPILLVSEADPCAAEMAGPIIACRPEEVTRHLELLADNE